MPEKPATTRPRTTACPICKKTVAPDNRWLPFCSDRCKTIDLGKWASGQYTISRPIEQADLDEV